MFASHAGLYAAGNLCDPSQPEPKPEPKPDTKENPKPDTEGNPKPGTKQNPKPDRRSNPKGFEPAVLRTPPPAHTRAHSFDSAWRADELPTPTDKETPVSSIALGFSPGSADPSTTTAQTNSPKKPSPKKPSPKKASPSSKPSGTPSPSKNSDLSRLSPTHSSRPSLKRAPSELSVSSSNLAKFDKYYHRFLGLQLALLHLRT